MYLLLPLLACSARLISCFRLGEQPAADNNTVKFGGIPKVIHSIAKSDYPHEEQWRAKNPGWRLEKHDDNALREMVARRFPNFPIDKMPMVLLADVARVIALQETGGVYFDNDVNLLVPIENWLATCSSLNEQQQQSANMIIGVEFPEAQPDGNPLQFTNWAMASFPQNPVFQVVLDEFVKRVSNITDFTSKEANPVQVTGPAAMTAAIVSAIEVGGAKLPTLEKLDRGRGEMVSLNMSGSVVNVAMLPYRAFGFHPSHKKWQNDPWTERLVKHEFHSIWRVGTVWQCPC